MLQVRTSARLVGALHRLDWQALSSPAAHLPAASIAPGARLQPAHLTSVYTSHHPTCAWVDSAPCEGRHGYGLD